MTPEHKRTWVQFLYDDAWDWFVSILVIVCALATDAPSIPAAPMTKVLMVCLHQLAKSPTTRTKLNHATTKHQVDQVVEFAKRVLGQVAADAPTAAGTEHSGPGSHPRFN